MKKLTGTAFLITFLIFLLIIGVSLIFENSRTEEIRKSFAETDVLWNDARFFSEYAANASAGECGGMMEENRKLGDRIYSEGLKIEKYEGANKLTDAILTEKKRYALLDLQFWKNSIEIRKKCGSEFSTVIYFYSQYNSTADQKLMDRILFDFKQRCGPATVYITLPVDMDLSSINLIKGLYNITQIPSVLINEETTVNGAVSLDELNRHAECW
ncbi:MAG: hypothetical protein KKB25_01335 [Nanoarchaeota archaeon]|nr:hypothetical protein [Nanoarchaeota archaeon]